MAKPLANGVPIGAVMTNDKVADMIKLGKVSSATRRIIVPIAHPLNGNNSR